MPRGFNYPVFEVPGSKYHTLNVFWSEKPQILGTWILWDRLYKFLHNEVVRCAAISHSNRRRSEFAESGSRIRDLSQGLYAVCKNMYAGMCAGVSRQLQVIGRCPDLARATKSTHWSNARSIGTPSMALQRHSVFPATPRPF